MDNMVMFPTIREYVERLANWISDSDERIRSTVETVLSQAISDSMFSW